MDTTPQNVDASFRTVYNFLVIGRPTYSQIPKNRNTVIKYTKIPDLESDTDTWPQLVLTKPRFRRTVSLEDPVLKTSRSVKSSCASKPALNIMESNFSRRKIVTISEDDEVAVHSKLSNPKIPISAKSQNRGTAVPPEKKPASQRTTRLYGSAKPPTDCKTNAKLMNKKETTTLKAIPRRKYLGYQIISDTPKTNRIERSKRDIVIQKRASQCVQNYSGSGNSSPSRTCLLDVPRPQSNDNFNFRLSPRRVLERSKLTNHKCMHRDNNISMKQSLSYDSKKTTTVVVPITTNKVSASERELQKEYLKYLVDHKVHRKDSFTNPDHSLISKDAELSTDVALKEDKHTEVQSDVGTMFRGLECSYSQTEPFESLIIPDVSLTKDREDVPKNCTDQKSPPPSPPPIQIPQSEDMSSPIPQADDLPSLIPQADDSPSLIPQTDELSNLIPQTDESSLIPQTNELSGLIPQTDDLSSLIPQTDDLPSLIPEKVKDNSRNTDNDQTIPYIIRHATLTYTTKQKINFQLIGKEDSIQAGSSLPLGYPINVVSVYKKETRNCEMTNIKTKESYKKKRKNSVEIVNDLNGIMSLNCSYVFNGHKLVKPSDIINTMRVNSPLFQSDDICEQFQRELNFIDSFFESLQYLESCSLSNKSFADNKVESLISGAGLDVNKTLVSKLGNGANFEDSETMASKSLCLLNLLIRDEQRRAKNLLFVLKMREDALKDFTKSQILWLENKKKQDNIDIPTLKKKQRGALLKLQHECGEMQRMRKALLTLSERRKVALMKTKKNIELKLQNSADVDQIILGKKKLKRISSDRNVAPVKCFDLSSSGCEEASSSRCKSDIPAVECPVTSAEKCVQTADISVSNTSLCDTITSNHFVSVDGGYLNILFHNLSLPQIFSKGKQYDVDEEALKNIVKSANSRASFSDSDVMDKLMDRVKSKESEHSSSPSTARSLVDELDQYYKDLTGDPLSDEFLGRDFNESASSYKIKGQFSQPEENNEGDNSNCSTVSVSSSSSSDTMLIKDSDGDDLGYDLRAPLSDIQEEDKGSQSSFENKIVSSTDDCSVFPTDDCPVFPTDQTEWLPTTAAASDTEFPSPPLVTSISSMSPIQSEAEELRRQQLAIEKEIKALEEQQCQLVIVREIPDKPPPPYTPPSESRVAKVPRMFLSEEIREDKVKSYLQSQSSIADKDIKDPFEVYIQDFCLEILERQKFVSSDEPWHPINVLPQKQALSENKLVRKTSIDLAEVLNGVKPTVVPGVSSRRSDHIDDILFTEWRRCEPEWTSLQNDEVLVKSQIFECIFQKILSETIEEYKKTVLGND